MMFVDVRKVCDETEEEQYGGNVGLYSGRDAWVRLSIDGFVRPIISVIEMLGCLHHHRFTHPSAYIRLHRTF